MGVAHLEGVLDIAGQALQVAQVGFDFQAQAEAVFAAQVGQEVMNLRIELETIGALRHWHKDVQTNPGVEQGSGVAGRGVGQLGGELVAQLHQAQGAGVETLAERFEQRPVFGEGAQNALGIDHRGAGSRQVKRGGLYCKRDACFESQSIRGMEQRCRGQAYRDVTSSGCNQAFIACQPRQAE